MAYYVLQDGFELCGWKGLPFGLRYPNPHYTDFFDREDYRLVHRLDGRHDIDAESLTDSQRKLLERLVGQGIAVLSDGTKTLAPWQAYIDAQKSAKMPGHSQIHRRIISEGLPGR